MAPMVNHILCGMKIPNPSFLVQVTFFRNGIILDYQDTETQQKTYLFAIFWPNKVNPNNADAEQRLSHSFEFPVCKASVSSIRKSSNFQNNLKGPGNVFFLVKKTTL